jgi:hypothetical protein
MYPFQVISKPVGTAQGLALVSGFCSANLRILGVPARELFKWRTFLEHHFFLRYPKKKSKQTYDHVRRSKKIKEEVNKNNKQTK